MAGGAFSFLDGRMDCFFVKPTAEVLMTGEAKRAPFRLQGEFVGKSVALVAGLALFFGYRGVDKSFCIGTLGFFMAIVTGSLGRQAVSGPNRKQTKQ
jgi:hypothetical protein